MILTEYTIIDQVNPKIFRTCALSKMYPDRFADIQKGFANKEYTFFLEELTKNHFFKVISEEEMVDIRFLRLSKNELVMSLVYDFPLEQLYFRVDAGEVDKARKMVDKVIENYLNIS